MKKFLVMTAAALLATTTMVSAATLSFISGINTTSLAVTGPSKVTFTLISMKSGVSQSLLGSWGGFFVGGGNLPGSYLTTQGPTSTSAIDFLYSSSFTTGSTLNSSTIANLSGFKFGPAAVTYSAITSIVTGESITAFFDNGDTGTGTAGSEMVVRIDVQAIPVPAAGALLLSGIGGLALARRRRKSA